MSIKIGNYTFEGPYASTDSLQDTSGIYVILDWYEGRYYPIDVGESANVKSRVEGHGRKDCWKRNKKGQLKVAVLYTPYKQQADRREIEQEIRSSYEFPCGEW